MYAEYSETQSQGVADATPFNVKKRKQKKTKKSRK